MKWTALVVVCVVLMSSATAQSPRIDAPVAEHLSCEAATLRASISEPATPTATVLYFGPHNGGHDPTEWEFSIPLGQRSAKTLTAPVEGLKPSTKYYFAFQASPQPWTETASFTTKPSVSVSEEGDFEVPRSRIPERGLVSTKAAARWEDGLLTGNGKMGAVVLSRPLDEKILLTQEKLFLPLNAPRPPIHMKNVLPAIRQAIREGQYQRSTELLMEQAAKEGYTPGMWTGSFLPAADLILHMEPQGRSATIFALKTSRPASPA